MVNRWQCPRDKACVMFEAMVARSWRNHPIPAHQMAAFPNFRRIYQDFRTPDQEKSTANSAVFTFCAFCVICALMTAAKNAAFAGQ